MTLSASKLKTSSISVGEVDCTETAPISGIDDDDVEFRVGSLGCCEASPAAAQ